MLIVVTVNRTTHPLCNPICTPIGPLNFLQRDVIRADRWFPESNTVRNGKGGLSRVDFFFFRLIEKQYKFGTVLFFVTTIQVSLASIPVVSSSNSYQQHPFTTVF